jgi:hypothetical protein
MEEGIRCFMVVVEGNEKWSGAGTACRANCALVDAASVTRLRAGLVHDARVECQVGRRSRRPICDMSVPSAEAVRICKGSACDCGAVLSHCDHEMGVRGAIGWVYFWAAAGQARSSSPFAPPTARTQQQPGKRKRSEPDRAGGAAATSASVAASAAIAIGRRDRDV